MSATDFNALYPSLDKNTHVLSDDNTIRNCIGCFGCWVKTPGVCVLKDGYENLGHLLSTCEELVIISRCVYGSYSPFVRNVLDRSIPYLLPYFVSLGGETHHKNRYNNAIDLRVHFYGADITPGEAETARALVQANSINFYVSQHNVSFHPNPQAIGEVLS